MRSRETFAVALRRPSLQRKCQHMNWLTERALNPRFAQVLVPSDIADVGHGDTVKDDGHVGGSTLVAIVACVASDIIRLVIDARTETQSSQGEGEDGQTEDQGNEGVF